jgi:NADH:ubiquinone oxidoreductase subunit 5 (subunit L)/multisubunit Na+/H+ antiporter MnhA subunit
MLLSIIVAAVGTLIAFVVYFWRRINADSVASAVPGLHRFLMNKWYFDDIYNRAVVGGTIALAGLLRWFDVMVIDGLVNGTASWTRALVGGYQDHAREAKFGAKVYLGLAVVVTVVITVVSGQMYWPGEATLAGVAMAILGSIATGGLTLFLFWAGAGGFDNRIIDGAVNAVAYLSGFGGLLLRKFQSGKVQTYIAFAVTGFMVLYFIFRLV